jgi:PadR family transcriptional regulator PadR
MSSGRSEQAPVVIGGSYLRCCLLLSIAEAPAHGYDLTERLSDFGLAGIDSAAVYRALRALDEEGLVKSWWEESGSGPVRRRYRISQEGLSCLEAWAASVGESASLLTSFVARHRRLRAVSAVGA